MYHVFWSRKRPCSDDAGAGLSQHGAGGTALVLREDPCALTVVTTLEESRLPYLEQLCGSWPGPLVAAYYVPLEQRTHDSGSLSDDNVQLMQKVLRNLQATFER
jgi:hypothetical protein